MSDAYGGGGYGAGFGGGVSSGAFGSGGYTAGYGGGGQQSQGGGQGARPGSVTAALAASNMEGDSEASNSAGAIKAAADNGLSLGAKAINGISNLLGLGSAIDSNATVTSNAMPSGLIDNGTAASVWGGKNVTTNMRNSGYSDAHISNALENGGLTYGQRAGLLGGIDALATSNFGANVINAGTMLASALVPGAGLALSLGDMGQKALSTGLSARDVGNLGAMAANSLVGGLPGAGLGMLSQAMTGNEAAALGMGGGLMGGLLGNALAPGWGGIIGGKIGQLGAGILAGQTGGEAIASATGMSFGGNGSGGHDTGQQSSAPTVSAALAKQAIDTSIPNVGRSGYSFF